MDFPNDILKKLDIITASIHSNFKQNPTKRIISAMENKYVDVIGHPTGRLINQREEYEIDLVAILKKAKETKTAIELNAHPWRLDLSDVNVKKTSEFGVLIAINTDAHGINDLNNMKYGIGTAKRGWLNKKHVLNCLNYKELMKWKNARMTD